MDSTNWRPTLAEPPAQQQPSSIDDGGDENWRSQFSQESRQLVINKVIDGLKIKVPLPASDHAGLEEMKRVAVRFEEKIYNVANNQVDYYMKISEKMVTMGFKFQNMNSTVKFMSSNSNGNVKNLVDSELTVANQSQTRNQTLLNQNIQIVASSGVQTGGIQSTPLSSVTAALNNQTPTLSNIVSQNPNLSSNLIGNSMVQQGVVPSNVFGASSQRQMQQGGRQQVTPQHSSQNQKYLYQQQKTSMLQQPLLSSQQLIGQQKNTTNLQQNQLLGQHSNITDMQQQRLLNQQQKLMAHGNPGMQTNQQSKVLLQQQTQQAATKSLQTHGQQSQRQTQLMSLSQSKTSQLQQQMNLQQQNSLQRGDIQQRILTSNANNAIVQQKNLSAASPSSFDSTAQTESANGNDWQEEIYQKIKTLKEKYFHDINGMYRTISARLLMHNSLPHQQQKPEQAEKMKHFVAALQHLVAVLQISKSSITPNLKDKIDGYEKQMLVFINSNRSRKAMNSMQQQGQQMLPSHMNSLQSSQHTQSQTTPIYEIQPNPQMQTENLQHASLSTVANTQQNKMNLLQPGSNIEQEQQMTQVQQLKQQLQQRQVHQQLMQKQQIPQRHQQKYQQQQLHMQQTNQQKPAHSYQMPQLNQMNGINLKNRHGVGSISGVTMQSGQRAAYHKQLENGGPFLIKSPQLLQASDSSPQIHQHSSPQIDQQNMISSITKALSPFLVPSPQTPIAPSPMHEDSDKPGSGVAFLTDTGHQQPNGTPPPIQFLAVRTPGIPASPLLAEFPCQDGIHGISSTIISGNSNETEQPLDRLINLVKSISPEALEAAISDIASVVSMVDMIGGSAPGNGSPATVGEDLIFMTKCRLKANNSITQDGTIGTKRMRRDTSAMPLVVAPSFDRANDSFKQLTNSETFDLDSSATSRIKRPRIEVNHTLMEEIKKINQQLIDVVVSISNEDKPTTATAGEGSDGTIVKCSFSAVSICSNLKSQHASALTSPIQPLRVVVPTNYPECSPVLLDKFPDEISKEHEDLSIKAKSKFQRCLRSLEEPISLEEIAKTWDASARAAISEYAQKRNGGTFSSVHGRWENCLAAT